MNNCVAEEEYLRGAKDGVDFWYVAAKESEIEVKESTGKAIFIVEKGNGWAGGVAGGRWWGGI